MRDEASGWISLHPGEFYLLWTELGLGELPAVLEIPYVGRTAQARAALVDLASRALADRDLGTVARPAADLEAMLRALAEPDIRLDLQVYGGPDVSFRAVGVAGGRGVVTAGAGDGDVLLGPVSRQALPAALLQAVPELPAGIGSPGNARMADYVRACRAGEHDGAGGFLDVLRRAGVRPSEANVFLRAVTAHTGGGWFGAGARSHDGRWMRAPGVVSWVDTGEGRYALRRRGEWVTVTPADPPRLLSLVEDSLVDLS
ncbi:ESX secretion-associated protein EspG [Prauserella muralis]|uniref:Uncharacterized protein n=1 Tax=Prauserella muralis TaxID=588067 RepID=A0A2V4B908_9PSEU|nr:ESX secretion-associated protein EspG [Prauserella muralis]PXY31905.1 hypothetical protein BAY60_06130 [Prauserella muralis]TWE13677.1 ESAT-6 protein secretion system EspG family protein [Prauserella muralis]